MLPFVRPTGVVLGGTIVFDDSRLAKNDGRVVGNVLEYNTVSPDSRVVADSYSTKNLSAGPDVHVVADHRGKPTTTTDSHLVRDDNVLPDLRPTRNDDTVDAVVGDTGRSSEILTYLQTIVIPADRDIGAVTSHHPLVVLRINHLL